jgi:hypothetical protein
MVKKLFGGVGAVALALVLALPMAAANKPATTTKTATHTTSVRNAWPAETLSGTIMTVNPTRKLVIVKDSNGVPFDMKVTKGTKIENGNQKLTLSELSADTNQSVSVRFVPERTGDVARTIKVG